VLWLTQQDLETPSGDPGRVFFSVYAFEIPGNLQQVDGDWNAKSTAVAAVSGSSPRTSKIQERATWSIRAASYPYPQPVSKVKSL